MVKQELFIQFLQVYAFQPATAYWRAIEIEVLRRYLPTKGVCLDLGCGDGKLTTITFDKKNISDLSLIGIDGDPDETAQSAQAGIYIRTHTSWAANIPEESATFDHIISNSVLEHIEDIEPAIGEVARLLKRGGKFVFTVPGPGFHNCLRGPLGSNTSRERYLDEIDQRLAHFRYWGKEDWQACLSKYGLTIIAQEEYLNCPEVQRWESISRFTAGVLYLLVKRKQTPIQVQKKLRLRQMQNRFTLPRWFAKILARMLSAGVSNRNLTDKFGCILIQAERIEK